MTEPDLETLQQRAQSGDATAQYSLANCYHQGFLGVTPDLEVAIQWYERAAAQGHTDSMVNLGVIELTELAQEGAEADATSACAWFERAAQLGDPGALYYLGRVYLTGNGVPQDAPRGIDLLEQAGARGDAEALHHLASIYDAGELVARDVARSVSLYRKAAVAGHPPAQAELAMRLLEGEGVPVDATQARRFLRLAADQGHAPSQYNLGVLMTNDGNPEAGMKWLHEAAQRGSEDAQYVLGQAYRTGRHTQQNPEIALNYYHAAAQQGHQDARFSLGLMLANGEGLDRPRPEQAEQWYQIAAMEGHGGAAHNLGTLFAKGNGVAQDMQLALELFEFAISIGNDDAMFSTGLAWLQIGQPQKAAKWGHLSIRNDPEGNGERLLEAALSQLSPEQAAEAERQAAEWQREEKTMVWMTRRGTLA